MQNKNLLVSFSGGETSAFMAQWLNNHYREFGYENIVFVFANTGLENEQTLEFVENCNVKFGLKLHWVEALVWQGERKGTGYTITDFEHAKRKGEPFKAIIEKYGIPNPATPHCTRELKQAPIKSFAKVWFDGEDYHTAIGIRKDEIDRMNARAEEMGFIYPLINSKMIPSNKQMVNIFWRSMPFRLQLKGYQGNCKTCWKKSDKKLYQIANENPSAFDFMDKMEGKYPRIGFEFEKEGRPCQIINGKYTFWETEHKIGDKVRVKTKRLIETEEGIYYAQTTIVVKSVENKLWFPIDRTFFRNNRSAKQIIEESKNWNGKIKDDSQIFDFQLDLFQDESCEVFSGCGD